MAITLIGHQPIDFTYKENSPCETLSDFCVQYETADNPQFQVKGDGETGFFVTIQGAGDTVFSEIPIPETMLDINGDYYTYTLNFEQLGITEGCFILCLYEASGDNLISNGGFVGSLTGWETESISLAIDSYVIPTSAEADDGEVTVIATGGASPFTYSNGGITYGASATFTGLSYGVLYTFYVKDTNGVTSSVEFRLRSCADFEDSFAFDIIDLFAFEIKGCEAYSFT